MAALPQLKLEQVWKPSRSGFDTDVTLVTQLSLERYFNTLICLVSTTWLTCILHVTCNVMYNYIIYHTCKMMYSLSCILFYMYIICLSDH